MAEISQEQKQQVDDVFKGDLDQSRYLTQNAAELRFNQITQGTITYKVDLVLKKGETFDGALTCEFVPKHADHDLFFEFKGQQIKALYVNAKLVTEVHWNQLFVRISKESLLVNEKNTVNIQYSTKYAGDGCGLHSFTDTDGKQYLYSQGESYFCNRFFPCMDQPDLKANLRFTVIAPSEWVVISNEHFKLKVPFSKGSIINEVSGYQPMEIIESQYAVAEPDTYSTWVFNETKLLPTYLFAIISGPYWSVQDENPHNNISQTVYCRESLKEHMLKMKDFVFEVTKESMKFYENFFGVPYQFSKYDSLFVAEYNWGAMENPGCVTFNDIYVFREQKPSTSYTQLANTIAHEMAHHWFGDYVTMKWWNDLWLNESYADFISHFCLEHLNIQSIKLSSIPVMFNMRKGWGYREDQMVTTHPIAGEVANTEVAENIFDGITYSKGAATMRQLLCIMGAEQFGQACGNYFKKFGWGNAKLEDLIACLQEKFQSDIFTLNEFKHLWIETAGMNEAEPVWENTHSANSTLRILQRPALSQFPTLRMHKIKVAFFTEDGTIHSQDVILNAVEETKVTYDGTKGYKAVILNYEDQSFLKVLLDIQSLNYFQDNLHLIKDVLTRNIIYRAIFDTVRDAKISSEQYVDVLLKCLALETSDEIIGSQLMCLSGAVGSMTPRRYKKFLSRKLFDFLSQELTKLLKEANPPQNRIILLRQYLLHFTHDDQVLDQLVAWQLGTNENLKGLELTNDSKWAIVKSLYASKRFDSQMELREQFLKKQLEADQSDAAKKAKVRCSSYLVNAAQRAELWESYCDPNNKESSHMLAESMGAFSNWRRYDEVAKYHEKFYETIIQIFSTRSTDFAKIFYENLFPDPDDTTVLCQKLEELIAKTPETQVTLKKLLSKSLDSARRQIRCHTLFLASTKLQLEEQ